MDNKKVILVGLCILLLTACSQKNQKSDYLIAVDEGEPIVNQEVSNDKKYTFEYEGRTEGTWQITIKGMRIVDSTSEWDINPDGFDTGAAPVIFNGSPVEIEDCVAEDGRHLKKDCVMLLIDMEAQNIDADSDMMSVDNKKYRFRADGFYVHLNPEHIQTQTSDSYQMIAYFSEMGQLENESAWCYEMKPGETKTYTIGIFLDDTLKTGGASGELDLSNLYLNDKMSLIDNNAIQLSEVDLYD